MARIEPIPFDELPEASRKMMEAGSATGMYTITEPMQVVAYSTTALTAMHVQYEATFRRGIIEPRLVELMRLRSANTAACEPCSASRKDESISEDDVACLADLDSPMFTPRESAALKFFDLLSNDHYAINDDTIRAMKQVFTTAEMIEVMYIASTFVGGHRFMHTLGIFSASEPIVKYEPGSIDQKSI